MAWSPRNANGWWPRLWVSPERRIFLAFGNFVSSLAELRRTADGGLETLTEVVLHDVRCHGGHWLHPYILTAWREREDLKLADFRDLDQLRQVYFQRKPHELKKLRQVDLARRPHGQGPFLMAPRTKEKPDL